MFARSPGDQTLAKELSALSTAILSDARAGRGVVAPALSRYAGSGTAAGRAITADCDEGALQAVFTALEHAAPDDFLCIKGPGDTAYLGDVLATNLMGRKLAGAIVDGLVRDRDRIATMPLTIMARGLTPFNRRAKGAGRPMTAITIGGVDIAPGDWIVADSDGVIVIAPGEAADAVAGAARNAAIEARVGELIRQGMPVGEAVSRATKELAGG